MKVEILLACFEGEKFLEEQLNSLFRQSFQDFTVLARDDGSKDRTLAILKDYQKKYPGRIEILPANGRLGTVGNFNALLQKTSADYIFFCDQDDVWVEDKLEMTLRVFQEHAQDMPLLVHTDLEVVDSEQKRLHTSFWKYSGFNPRIGRSINRLLVQNVVTGCTMAINKELKQRALPIPKEVIMHDWWLALLAAACGKIISLPRATVFYRQHGKNVLGAKKIGLNEGLRRLFSWMTDREANTENAEKKHAQGALLYLRVSKEMKLKLKQTLEMFLKAPALSIMARKRVYLTHRFFRQGITKIVPYLLQNRPF